MRTQTYSGFTIIEVMLFLAITGALMVGILIGSSAAIGQQRYRDSVNSFKGHIQEQYGKIANVINSEATNPVCDLSDTEAPFSVNEKQYRGTSDCLVMGRFTLINGDTVTSYNLLGQPGIDSAGDDDITTLQSYNLAIDESVPEVYEINWGARIVRPQSNDDITTSILIVRSPISGAMLTYVMDDDKHSSIEDMLSEENMAQKDFCVDSGGGSGTGNRMAVRIGARAGNQSAVEIPLEKENVCGE